MSKVVTKCQSTCRRNEIIQVFLPTYPGGGAKINFAVMFCFSVALLTVVLVAASALAVFCQLQTSIQKQINK